MSGALAPLSRYLRRDAALCLPGVSAQRQFYL